MHTTFNLDHVLCRQDLQNKTIAELCKLTLVYEDTAFSRSAYLIPSKKGLLLDRQQATEYFQEHTKQTYLILKYGDLTTGNTFQYVENYPNYSIITFLLDDGRGYLRSIGSIRCDITGYNNFKVSLAKTCIDPTQNSITPVATRHDSGITFELIFSGEELIGKKSRQVRNWGYSYGEYTTRSVTDFICLGNAYHLFNTRQRVPDVLKYCLNIVNDSRIYQEFRYDSINLKVGMPGQEELSLPVKARYALVRDSVTRRNYYGNRSDQLKSDETCDVELSAETIARVTEDIRQMLFDRMKTNSEDTENNHRYSNNDNIISIDIMVIGDPMPGHRRPTYHILRGASNAGYVDVVEFCRGELQMKDMQPVNCYCLFRDTMKYEHVTDRIYSNIKSSFFRQGEIQVDPITLGVWSEEKAIIPTLLKSLAQYTRSYPTSNEVMTFNRAKFGSLFMEHLIKAGKKSLAFQLCSKINASADVMGDNCDSLSSILPGCNPTGTSLMETLGMSKPWCNKLWDVNDIILKNNEYRSSRYSYRRRNRYSDCSEALASFLCAYNIVRSVLNHCAGSTSLSKDSEAYIDDVMLLESQGLSTIDCQNGDSINVAADRDLTKSIAKMIRRITARFGAESDSMRSYKEIVTTYVRIKAYGWVPEEMMVFIEFSLGGEDAYDNIKSRERAADTTYKAYQAKLDEANRRRNEEKYAIRAAVLRKLQSPQDKPILHRYIVVAPSQIYDENIDYSLEKEGNDQHHCVFRSYATDLVNGKYTVLYLRDANNPTRSLVTIGINAEGRINQTYGYYNRQITKEEAMAIIAWAKTQEGRVTFATDSGTPVQPGGWNPDVPVVELEKINREWITKMSKTN